MAARLLRPVHLAAVVAALLGTPGVAHAVPAGKVVFSAEPATSTDIDGGYGYVAWTLRRSGHPWEIHWRRADGSVTHHAFSPSTRVERLQIVRIVPPRSSQRITRLLSRGCDRRGCRVYAIDPETRAVSTPRWAATIFGRPADGPLYITGLRTEYKGTSATAPYVKQCPSLRVHRIDGTASWTLPELPGDPTLERRSQPDCNGTRQWAFRGLRLAVVYRFSDLDTTWEAPRMIAPAGGPPSRWAELPGTAYDSWTGSSLTLGLTWIGDAVVSATAGERGADTDAFRSPALDPSHTFQTVNRLSRRQLAANELVSDGTSLYLHINGVDAINTEYDEKAPRGLGIRENRVIIERVPPPQWRATPRS